MGKKAPSAPPAPDYAAAAQAQGQANLQSGLQSAVLSNPNIISPYGNQTVTWATDPNNPGGAPQATVNQTLTPDAQAALTAQQQVQKQEAQLASQGIGRASDLLNTGFDFKGPGVQTGVSADQPLNYGFQTGVSADQPLNYGFQNRIDTSGIAQMPVNAGMTAQNAIMSRLQPQIQQTQEATAQRLANQGIPQGSEAWNNAMRQQGQDFNDLYTQAAAQGIGIDMNANNQGFNQQAQQANLYNQAGGLYNAAVGQGFNQQAQQANLYNQAGNLYNSAVGQGFNQNLQAGQFANNANQQSYAQQLGLYNQPLNQITALMSGSQIQNPQFQQYTGQNIQAAPVFQGAQAQGQYNQGLYGQQMAGYNAQMGALGNLVGTGVQAAASYFSDARLKTNIVRVGIHPLGIGVYDFDIFGERQRGVMAQEVLAVKPEAVSTDANGWFMVDYGQL